MRETIDFILDFTNKAIQKYATSDFDKSVLEIEIRINDEIIQKQHLSNCLWNLYRGAGVPNSPYLLQSIHMALEKFFLEIGKEVKSNVLENWLIYLLQRSESASISSVVASIVLAYPEKTFNVAKILFKTKEFIVQDTGRLVLEQGAKSLYSIGQNFGGHNFYDQERIGTCEDKHRKRSLEYLFLSYQLFRSEETSEEEAEKRQQDLWDILDNYYKGLPKEPEQTEEDKIWRLFLARMDKRKMNITTEETDNGFIFQFDPEIAQDIKKLIEEEQKKSSKQNKYIPLKLWAELRFKNDNKYKEYEQYETNWKLAIKDTKDIIEGLNDINAEENFFLFNRSIPAYVCTVILRDYIEELTKEEKSFCSNIVLEISFSVLHPNYHYQISDGVEPAISVLPKLLEIYPERKFH